MTVEPAKEGAHPSRLSQVAFEIWRPLLARRGNKTLYKRYKIVAQPIYVHTRRAPCFVQAGVSPFRACTAAIPVGLSTHPRESFETRNVNRLLAPNAPQRTSATALVTELTNLLVISFKCDLHVSTATLGSSVRAFLVVGVYVRVRQLQARAVVRVGVGDAKVLVDASFQAKVERRISTLA